MDIKCPNLYYSDPSDPFPFKGNQLKACIEYLYYLKSADDMTINHLRSQPNSTCFRILFINLQKNTTYDIPIIRSNIQEAITQVELKMDQEAKVNSTKKTDIYAEPKISKKSESINQHKDNFIKDVISVDQECEQLRNQCLIHLAKYYKIKKRINILKIKNRIYNYKLYPEVQE